jgi:hypothetical protein
MKIPGQVAVEINTLGDQREIARRDVLNNIVRNFSQQPAKETALDMLERAASVRCGAIGTFQKHMYAVEIPDTDRAVPKTLLYRTTQIRQLRMLEERISQIAEEIRNRSKVLTHIMKASAIFARHLGQVALNGRWEQVAATYYWRKTHDRDRSREVGAPPDQTEIRQTPSGGRTRR